MVMGRAWARAALATALATVMVLAGTVARNGPAAAAPKYGYDISWPQCRVDEGGYDLPMPPRSADFVIVGLTRGLPFTENPCLRRQVRWVRRNDIPAHAYTMAAFPTQDQVALYRSAGPWSDRTRAGRLSNTGYAEAAFAVASLERFDIDVPTVWIDVEPRPAQPWPTGAPTERANRYVIEGVMRGLHDAGYSYGLYSYDAGWDQIVGSWRLPGVAVWATAGRLDYPDEARDRCRQESFSGGRVKISQWYDDVRDYDRTCGRYKFTPLPIPPSSLSNSTADFDADWTNDVMVRLRGSGELLVYPGNGRGGLRRAETVARDWRGLRNLESAGDLTSDGKTDLVAREADTGYLWLFPGNGRGGLKPRKQIGTGWKAMNSVIGPGDFDGDQLNDLLARHRRTGELWLYPGDGRGGLQSPTRIGSGWERMSAIAASGDLNGDAKPDIVARVARTGTLWLYPGDGRGGLQPRERIGRGWNAVDMMTFPGDLDGDRRVDLLVRRTSDGALVLHAGVRGGGFDEGSRIRKNWTQVNAMF